MSTLESAHEALHDYEGQYGTAPAKVAVHPSTFALMKHEAFNLHKGCVVPGDFGRLTFCDIPLLLDRSLAEGTFHFEKA